jgi:GT2 family glycosyltransferase
MLRTPEKLAIILVSWNTRDYLEKCLISLYHFHDNPLAGVWVIDNASSDDSVEMVRIKFPQVRLLCNAENVGFARACNQGIRASDAEYILLLNSDCELTEDFINPILSGMEREKKIGVAGAVLLHANGRGQKAGGDLLSLKKVFKEQLFFRSAALFADDVAELAVRYGEAPYFNADFVSGACLFTRRSVLDQIGLLREDFFMYGEDLEFCLRAQRRGYATVIFTNTFVVHHKCQSTNKNLEQALRHGLVNNVLIIAELEGKWAAGMALLLYFIGGWLRFILAFFRPGISASAWFKLLFYYHRVVRAVLEKL